MKKKSERVSIFVPFRIRWSRCNARCPRLITSSVTLQSYLPHTESLQNLEGTVLCLALDEVPGPLPG